MKSLQIFRIFFSMLLLVAIISCDKDTDEEDNSQAISNAELRLAAQVDNTEDQSFSIVENAYVETEEVSRSSVNSFFSNCASITVHQTGMVVALLKSTSVQVVPYKMEQ